MISEMDRLNLNIMTAEDPVEYQISEVCQTAVNDATGMSFANILRSFLRNDPDIIVVGEMRDSETAEIALRAAESGHMMISTLHTNDVAQSLNRLAGMLDEDYKPMGIAVLSHNLKAIVNQRLIRTICPHCHHKMAVKELSYEQEQHASHIGLAPTDIMAVVNKEGCDVCDYTGYYGRVLAPEAAFFPNDLSVQNEIERIMNSDGDTAAANILELDGVEYFSRKDTTKQLLLKNLIDLKIASDLLDLSFVNFKNKPNN
jgi:type II secretory ATPase GspE/PulE/Tfp pilus assembly ATPase PilB-like protein